MAFRDVIGHRRLISLLERAVVSNSVPPSLIFSGPDGVGKQLVALSLAQAVNCLNPVDVPGGRDACGQCASCSKIARGLHPDVIVLAPEEGSAVKIEQVREVVGRTAYRPFEGRLRVAIFDQAELMAAAPQNALLKTLEEPPGSSAFILVTSRPDMLLDTVRSRCCHFRFAPLSAGEIAGGLVARHGYAEHDARAVAALADGSYGRALAARAEELGEARAIAAAVLQQAAGSRDAKLRFAAAAALLQVPSRKGREKKSRDSESDKSSQPADRGALGLRLRAMGSLLRDVAILITRAPDAALVNLDLRSELDPLARSYDHDGVMRAFAAVGRALGALERHNGSPKIIVDWLAFQL
jgi:DNA polymerase-3 subunit delta'